MTSQSFYHTLQDCIGFALNESRLECTDEVSQFIKPYVLVIHHPSGRGFYLDRQYRHIVNVKNCQEPKNPVEVARHHLCVSSDLPDWASTVEDGISRIVHFSNFDSFWLY